MLAALEAMRGEYDFVVVVRDVEQEAALEERYGELVPFLAGAAGEEICHYFLDAAALREYLAKFR